jgi:hypothetical protein
MDIFVTVMMVAMLLLVVIVGAAVFVQQSGTLRDIQHKLDLVEEEAKKRKDPEALRRERVAVLDPLMLLESQLYSRKPQTLTEEEIELISTSRTRVTELSEDLKQVEDWLGAPYDLEWYEYLERMPLIKTLYLNAGFAQESPPQITSGS